MNWIATPYTAGPGSFVDMLIQRAGGFNVGASLEGEWATISLEELLVQDPNHHHPWRFGIWRDP